MPNKDERSDRDDLEWREGGANADPLRLGSAFGRLTQLDERSACLTLALQISVSPSRTNTARHRHSSLLSLISRIPAKSGLGAREEDIGRDRQTSHFLPATLSTTSVIDIDIEVALESKRKRLAFLPLLANSIVGMEGPLGIPL